MLRILYFQVKRKDTDENQDVNPWIKFGSYKGKKKKGHTDIRK